MCVSIEKSGGKAALDCQRIEDNAFHPGVPISSVGARWIGFSEDDGKEFAEGAMFLT
jgi:hypothetical protein